ncbi:tumor necrosis factor receptor superfamily member 5 [Puntigrus tetrazona]|uniref:tumor necrosis factor receptor superfamily member 5 n=1 Tax=Puntigrus tetrazona TaxID=1606681 RepID=UPI001C89D4C0|nr:tumor necrosis factor receptor superfamily member 5 [Puntigrus tetrazona]
MRVYFLCALVALLHLVSCCEKETHYLKGEECCKKCGPGKRMLMNDDCKDPRCQDCEDGEYQSGYTSETRCDRQPSCDVNLHFKPEPNPSKTSLVKCQCKPGYYCTQDDDCNSCREHTACKPGQRVAKTGSAVSDTVCEACKNGTFSTRFSADVCKEWTKCADGFENAPGSSTSDRICADGKPNNRTVIGVVLAVVFVVGLILVVAVCNCTGSNKSCKEFSKKAETITGIRIKKLEADADIERAIQPLNQQPEEDDDDSIPVSPTLSNMTENGNPVQQEHGKESVSSHPESNSIL